MSRPQTPWYRKQTGWWMVEFDGEQKKLVKGPKDEAHRKLAEEKMVELRQLRRVAPDAEAARVADVIDAFLRHSRTHLSADTYRMHLYYLQLFAEHSGTVGARELKPYHVTEWVTEMKSPERVERQRREWLEEKEKAPAGDKRKFGSGPRVWGDTTVYNARRTVFRAFNWAKDEGLLKENPLATMKRPKPPKRRRAMRDEEFQQLYERACGPFKDFLMALRETGARPQELRELTWNQVDEAGEKLVLAKHKTSKVVGKDRVIYLSSTTKEMIARLKGNGHTHVFLNTEGQPWTRNAVRLQVWRLKKALGLAEDLCAYLCRHGFGTRAILRGVDATTVAELMGHSSLEMVSQVYVHLAEEHEHLKAAVEKISGGSPTPSPAETGQGQKTSKRAKPVKKPPA